MAKIISLNDAYYQLGYIVARSTLIKQSVVTQNTGFFRIPFSGTVFSVMLQYVSAMSATVGTLGRETIRLVANNGSGSVAKASIVASVGKKRGQITAWTAASAFTVKTNDMLVFRHTRQGAKIGAYHLYAYIRPQV